MRKAIAAWVLAALVTSVSFATGTSEPGMAGPNAQPQATGVDAYAPVPDKQYEFSFVPVWMGVPVGDDPSIIGIYEEKHNVDMEVVYVDFDNYNEDIGLKLAAGEIPDFFPASSWEQFRQFYDQGIIAPIPVEVIERYAPNLYAEYTEYDPEYFARYGVIDGTLYGIPVNEPGADRRHVSVYRGDWLDAIGWDRAPDTIEEFEQVMYAFAHEDPDGNGIDDTYGLSATGINAVLGAFGFIVDRRWPSVHWARRDGRIVFAGIQPEMKQALALLQKWYRDGVLDPEFITGENANDGTAVPFVTGRIGYTTDGPWWNWMPPDEQSSWEAYGYDELRKLNPEAAAALVHARPPMGPGGHRGVKQEKVVTGSIFCFGIHMLEQPDMMGKILQVMDDANFASYENIATSFFGEQGEAWVLNAAGLAESTDPDWDWREAQEQGGHTIMRSFNSFKWREVPEHIEWCRANGFYEDGISDQLFKALPSSGLYWSDLKDLTEQAYVSIITGDQPIDYFDEYVRAWRESGGDVLEREANM